MKLFLLLLSFIIFINTGIANPSSKYPHRRKIHKEVLPTFVIKKSLIVDATLEPKTELIKLLINKLESEEGEGKPVTRSEFLSLFERKEAKSVYTDKLVRYATPKSQDIQKAQHDNYTKYLLTDDKINEGINFKNKHSELLDRAEKKYGVYKQDIVSILMWESDLGKFSGVCRVFNIFMAQILFLDAAQNFAIKQIIKSEGKNPFTDFNFKEKEQKRILHRKNDAVDGVVSLLRYCKEKNLDPLDQKGSWGGAIGYVQFMPFNLKYAVDADSDGVINLYDWPDAIYSVASYLHSKGNYTKDDKGRRAAVFSYNHSAEYVNGVILYADEISKKIK